MDSYSHLLWSLAAIVFYRRYDAFQARCLLAAIDHNHHASRAFARKQSNREIKFHRKYSKSSGQWTVSKVRVEKNYSYMPELIKRTLDARAHDAGTISDRTEMVAGHPSRIAHTIAPVPPPQTTELVLQQSSRTGNVRTIGIEKQQEASNIKSLCVECSDSQLQTEV